MKALKNTWYAAAWDLELTPGALLPRRILGEALVLYRDAEGRPVAAADRCPHRLAPLSATRGVSPAPPELAIPPWLGSPEQEHALAELRRRIAAGEFAAAASDDATLRWFLLDRRLDVDAAEHKLLRMLQWRQQIG